MHKVTVIIPNYNGIQYLDACLCSLQKQSFQDFSIVLVDNGSTDASLTYVEHHFPSVQCIPLLKNQGFSYAVNIGIQHSDSPYVLLLNTDTILTPDFLAHMVQQMESSEQIFSVGSKMLQAHHPDCIDTTGDFYTICGYAFCRGQGQDAHRFTKSTEIFTACAGAALYRRSAFAQIGLFDTRFFAYLEDVDIGYRARLFGWKNVYCPTAIVYHIGGGTSGHGHTPFKVYHSARNNLFLLKKNMDLLQIIINYPLFIIGFLLKYLYYRKRGLGDSYRKGIKEGLQTLSQIERIPSRHAPEQKIKAWHIQLQLICHTFHYVLQYTSTHLLRAQRKI